MWQNKFMKRIVAILLLSLVSTTYALPNCPSDQSVRWHNCFGTYTCASGTKDSGYWMNGKFVPDICEGMELRKDISEFGQCVLKLIDKL